MFGSKLYKSPFIPLEAGRARERSRLLTGFMEQRGFLLVVAGPMGSGKTTELFRQLERVEIAGGKTMLFKPWRDDRVTGVKTHSGYERQAIALKHPEELFENIPAGITAIGIEEAQIFDFAICGVVRRLVARGLRVIAAGLDLDAMARPFGPMPLLMAQAEYVIKLQAVCMQCGADASRTKRKIDSKEQVVIGGMDIYEPVCTACHERWLAGGKDDEL